MAGDDIVSSQPADARDGYGSSARLRFLPTRVCGGWSFVARGLDRTAAEMVRHVARSVGGSVPLGADVKCSYCAVARFSGFSDVGPQAS